MVFPPGKKSGRPVFPANLLLEDESVFVSVLRIGRRILRIMADQKKVQHPKFPYLSGPFPDYIISLLREQFRRIPTFPDVYPSIDD